MKLKLNLILSRVMRKQIFCIVEKDTDQRPFFSPKFQASGHLLWLIVADLGGNPETDCPMTQFLTIEKISSYVL